MNEAVAQYKTARSSALDLEFPDDADPGDWITLEGAGLFEDELYDDEPVPTSGDLHLLFFVV